MPHVNHLFPENTAQSPKFTRPGLNIDTTFRLPYRDRKAHADFLKKEFDIVSARSRDLKSLRKKLNIKVADGIYVSFISDPGFEIKFERLDLRGSGFELLAVVEIENKWYATVFIPDGKLKLFVEKIDKYATEESRKSRKPINKELIESIADIRQASLEALWTDDRELFPAKQTSPWWEVWIRRGNKGERCLEIFKKHAADLNIAIGSRVLSFPE